jgi:hypothetical protein
MQTDFGKIGIGTKETATKLQPQKVKIVNYSVEMQKTKEGIDVGEKVTFTCKHPAKEELIEISSVAYRKGKEIKTSGTWFKLDTDNCIVKGSATACLISSLKANNLEETRNKEVETELDDKGYLVFKAY